jgi:glycosyltransferase involved in cell wall biosynthesis
MASEIPSQRHLGAGSGRAGTQVHGAPLWRRCSMVSRHEPAADSVNPPLVSICIPTYNRPEYLRRAVESCLAQTFRLLEIVITDNSTNDQTANAAKNWTDPRIRYYSNGGSIGTAASMDRAVSLSAGKYIKFLMDDDLLKPRCLERMVKALEENPTAGIAMAPMDLIDEEDRRIFPRFYIFRTMHYRYRYQVGDGLVDRRKILRDFLTRDYPCTVPSGIMYRAEALRGAGKVPLEAGFAGDLALCMKVAAHWDFYYLDEALSSFRFIAISHTAKMHQTGSDISAFYIVTRQCLADGTVKEMFRDEWGKIYRDSIFFCSCRALLNGLAGIRSRSPRLILGTIQTILQEDRHVVNLLRLPLWVLEQIWVSIFPAKLPPPRQ